MRIFNTMTRRKEEFTPLHEGEARIYCCGPTVYNYFHLGNARPFVIFDVLRRFLAYRGYKVTFVQNFTDVDDKMIRGANEEGVTIKELGERYIAEYFKDADALNVSRATVYPKATEHIGEIIALVQALIDKGMAYEVDGDVYFRTEAFPGYGKLSGQNMEDLAAGARIDVDERKRDPMDFALWKAQKPGEPAWDSPWGPGRPGWHIECSAMSMKYLGETFDIHCGGVDLIFPHHENEIAQSEGATGHPFARYWMHNGHINVNNEKMSKSKGNFFTVRDIAKQYDLEAVRLFLLSAQYRSPINYSADLIEQAVSALKRLYTLRDHLLFLLESAGEAPTAGEEALAGIIDGYRQQFVAAMEDDLNTADALGVLFELVRELNTFVAEPRSRGALQLAYDGLMELAGVLGLLYKQRESAGDEVTELARQRQEARQAKNWAEADRLREAIRELGYAVEDTPEGPKLKKL